MNTRLIHDKIMDGTIKNWPDVYGYTNPTEMSNAFGRSPKHWETVRYSPLKITIGDMDKITEALDISKKKFLEVVEGED